MPGTKGQKYDDMSGLRITRMAEHQLQEVSDLADEVYPKDLYESFEALRSRWLAYPQGAIVLLDPDSTMVCGYSFFHPWFSDLIVPLNTILKKVPRTRTAYLHDMAIMPELRGEGYGADLALNTIDRIISQGFRQVNLVAVMDSQTFWQKVGFSPIREVQYGEHIGIQMSLSIAPVA
jgi:GNAT superfamily N-acetyltransferase